MNFRQNYGNTAISPLSYNFNDANSRNGYPQPRTSNITQASNRSHHTRNGARIVNPNVNINPPVQVNHRPPKMNNPLPANGNFQRNGHQTPISYASGQNSRNSNRLTKPQQNYLNAGGQRISGRPSQHHVPSPSPNGGNNRPNLGLNIEAPRSPISAQRHNYNPLMGNMKNKKQPPSFNQNQFSSPQPFNARQQQHGMMTPTRGMNDQGGSRRNPLDMKFQSKVRHGFSPTPSTSRRSLLADDFEEAERRSISAQNGNKLNFGNSKKSDWKYQIKKSNKSRNVIIMKTKPLYQPTDPKFQYNFKGILRPKGAKSAVKKNLSFNNDVEVYNVESYKLYNVDMGKRARKRRRSSGKDECSLI